MTERTLVDTNVLLDIVTEDATWAAWSGEALADAADSGILVLSPIVYAELGARFARIEDLDDVVSDFVREPLPWDAAFLAGRAHAQYRLAGGTRDRTLPDFLIGAHAAVRDYRLLTRDGTRYRTAFPRLTITSP